MIMGVGAGAGASTVHFRRGGGDFLFLLGEWDDNAIGEARYGHRAPSFRYF